LLGDRDIVKSGAIDDPFMRSLVAALQVELVIHRGALDGAQPLQQSPDSTFNITAVPTIRVVDIPVRGRRLEIQAGVDGTVSSNCAGLEGVDHGRGADEAGVSFKDALVWSCQRKH
jgi:hypothetical protein